MTINEMIERLTDLRDKFGDIPVHDTDGNPIIGINHDNSCGCCPNGAAFIEAEF